MPELLTTLRQRLDDAESDAERLRAAIAVLEESDGGSLNRRRSPIAHARTAPEPSRGRQEPKSARARTAPKRAQARRKPQPAAEVVPNEKLLKVVAENPGRTTTRLAALTGGDQSAILTLLKESEEKGEVRREGERRATSWYRITDEDRVAVRATEIAAQAKAAPKHKRSSAAKVPRRKAAVEKTARTARSEGVDQTGTR